MLSLLRQRGDMLVDITRESELEYASHCRDADVRTAAFRDCLSYYNGEGNAEPGSLAYYGGPDEWHRRRKEAQASLAPYIFAAGRE